ncbi:MAG: hypothetical protein CM1200mP18_17070 [Gammaproteobacteria bacterium]|nr:MAG: hypothetical protein CM1200mP18_17070 [Gammaproteobacteria bacterium]
MHPSKYRMRISSHGRQYHDGLVAALIGPELSCIIQNNSKQPGGQTNVKWHQGFSFTPHSNDSVVTALLMIDEVNENNGPLEVLAGSHVGPYMVCGITESSPVPSMIRLRTMCPKGATCTGPPPGCLPMHTRLLHGSKPNRHIPDIIYIRLFR